MAEAGGEEMDPLSWMEEGSYRGIRRPLTREGVLEAVRSYRGRVGAEDALVVIFTGHGNFDPGVGEGGPRGTYLTFRRDEAPLYVSELESELRGVQCRLRVLLVDCCSRLRPIAQRGPTAPLAPAAPAPDEELDPLFRRLFWEERGTLVVESSSPNEYAYIEPTRRYAPSETVPRGVEVAGPTLFGDALAGTLTKNADQSLSWEEVMELTQDRIDLRLKELRYARLLTLDAGGGAGVVANQRQTLVVRRSR
jgi:hypothetical protein